MELRRGVLLSLYIFSMVFMYAEQPMGLEFIDRPIEEILLVLADGAGFQVFPDETVSGRDSFYAPGGDSVAVFQYFLDRHGLFMTESLGVNTISRVFIKKTESGKLILKANGVTLKMLTGRLSRDFSTTILHDPFPATELEVNTVKENLGELLKVLLFPLEGWRVWDEGELYYLAGPGSPGNLKPMFSGLTRLRMKNITGAELVDLLTPEFNKHIIQSPDKYTIFYSGDEDKLSFLKAFLEKIDLPRPQLRYDLLIVNLVSGEDLHWSPDFSVSSVPDYGRAALLGGTGRALSLNFDLLASFGYQFVLNMDLALEQSRARIIADTTLCGLSGEPVRFFNSRTSRFKPLENTEGEGVEFKTGTFIEITGTLDGMGMILLEVSISQSNRESGRRDESELPSSIKKGIEASLRARPGEPLIIGGFRQDEKRLETSGIPLLCKIPLLGLLFQRREELTEKMEMILYIVPRVEKGASLEEEEILNAYFKKYGGLFCQEEE